MTFLDPSSVPADDRGLLLGDGLFETIRLYRGRPFRLNRHLRRLRDGAGVIGIDVPEGIEGTIEATLQEWGRIDGALRITLTRGAGAGLLPSHSTEGRLLLLLRPLEPDRAVLPQGLRAVIRGRVDERALTIGLKALGYLERIQAVRLANEVGMEEALLQNSTGDLVEGAASNLFGVYEGVLIAPGVREGALPGITREVLLEEAKKMSISIEERGIPVEEVGRLSELFLSSSLREVAHLSEVEGVRIGSGAPGPIFRALSERYAAAVEGEVGR
jgi:branched-subunit amino acid aminotransferase/4-amino-4-deoxychorismate lyase